MNTILNEIRDALKIKQPLKNKNVLITAGPTLEPIDPVRFISNQLVKWVIQLQIQYVIKVLM